MVTEADIRLADGRTLHAYDTGADGIASSPGAPGSAVAVFWLHGSPNIGSPPEPDADHVTVLDSAPAALTWLAARVRA